MCESSVTAAEVLWWPGKPLVMLGNVPSMFMSWWEMQVQKADRITGPQYNLSSWQINLSHFFFFSVLQQHKQKLSLFSPVSICGLCGGLLCSLASVAQLSANESTVIPATQGILSSLNNKGPLQRKCGLAMSISQQPAPLKASIFLLVFSCDWQEHVYRMQLEVYHLQIQLGKYSRSLVSPGDKLFWERKCCLSFEK